MSKDWFPWYPARFRADTMHLTAEQDGIYRRLIDHYMETGVPLPDNDAALARIAGISCDSWAMAAAILRPFFRQHDGKLWLKKCDEILADQAARSEKNSRKGKAGATKRWKSPIETTEVNSIGHCAAMEQAKPEDATRQDITGTDKESPPYPPVEYSNRFMDRARLSDEIPASWLTECITEMGWPQNVATDVWTKFSGHQKRKIGQAGLKTPDEWGAEWRTWYRKENIRPSAQGVGRAASAEPILKTQTVEQKQRANELLQKFQQGART